eukprot:433440_1
MGNSKSKKKKHNCLKDCFNNQLNKFILQCIPPVWSLTDEHIQILKHTFKFPNDVIEIILLYLPQKNVFIQTKSNPDFMAVIRCIDNSYIDIITQKQYKSPYPFCKDYPILPEYNQYRTLSDGERCIHIGMFGQGGVGKTALTDRYVKGEFINEYDPGIEDLYVKYVQLDGCDFMCEILDSYGQEEFEPLMDEWIKNTKVFIVCFSVMNKRSLDHIDGVIKKIIEINKVASKQFAIVICGNKIDLRNEHCVKDAIEMDYIVNKIINLGIPYIETSAKTDTNVDYLYSYAIYAYWFQTVGSIIDWDDVTTKLVF